MNAETITTYLLQFIFAGFLSSYAFFLRYKTRELEALKDEVSRDVKEKMKELKTANERKTQNNYEHNKRNFRRLDALELNVSLLALQHKHLEASGDWVKDPSKKPFIMGNDVLLKKVTVRDNETPGLIL